MDQNARKLVFAGTGLVVILAVGITLYLVQSDQVLDDATDDGDQASQGWLSTWSTEDATDVDIAPDEAGIPTVAVDDASFALGPADLSWEQTRRGASTVLTATGDASPSLSWEFAGGNPTAILRAQKDVAPGDLAEPITVALELPGGELEGWTVADGFHAIDAYNTRAGENVWLRWSRGDSSVTFRGWNGDGFAVRPSGSGGYTVEMALWRPEQHPRIVECLGELGDHSVQLKARAMVEFRALPRMVAWPYPNGAEAMMLPILVAPELHSDPQLAEARARNARDFVDRVTTVAYGHSSPKDPRYGNGGLLGHGLGGTVVAHARLLGKSKVQKLAKDLGSTRVGIAAGGPVSEDAPYAIRYANEVGCASLRSTKTTGVISPSTDESSASLREAPRPFGAQVFARVLDGRLDSLLAQGFSRAYADEALRNRDIYAFVSPLVATRNPLIGAAADALLEPERKGMWTVSPRLAGGLADVELWREEHPIAVSSVGDLVRYRAFSRDAALVWAESGAPRVSGTAVDDQIGYTIALNGEAELPDTVSPPPRVRVVETKNGPVTLLSWDAAPDTSSLELQRDLRAAAVSWNIAEE